MPDDRPFHEAHPELFHYTSIGGLEGILRSQSLWGTHWQHLNDSRELGHFCELLATLLTDARTAKAEELARTNDAFKRWAESQGGIDAVVAAEVSRLVQVFHESVEPPDPKDRIFEFYVTSFCTPEGSFEAVRSHGLLSMWRCYGNGGYALVFDTAQLERLLHVEAEAWPCRLVLGDVGYSCDSADDLDARITSLPNLRKIFRERSFDSQETFDAMVDPLLDCFIHYKHWAFAEEREVRLTATMNGHKMQSVHADEGTTWPQRLSRDECGAPRIHLFEGLGHRLPIQRIIVGPGPCQPERTAKLRALLDELGLDIPLTLSDIPVRTLGP